MDRSIKLDIILSMVEKSCERRQEETETEEAKEEFCDPLEAPNSELVAHEQGTTELREESQVKVPVLE
jgi:hypothetical protein